MDTEYGIKFVPPHVNAGEILALPVEIIPSFLRDGNCMLVKRPVGEWIDVK